jgi:hypothetical protein
MGRVIARVAMLEKPKDVLIHVLALVFIVITVALDSLSIPPWEKAIYTGVSTLISAIAGASLILMLHRMVVVTFTEDGLVIERGGRRKRVFIPKSVVITGNVICIRRGPKPILDVTYESLSYTIPLSQRQYDRLVNGLTIRWSWIPPECPEQLIQAR